MICLRSVPVRKVIQLILKLKEALHMLGICSLENGHNTSLGQFYTMRFVVTICSIQLISHRVNEKTTPISIKEVKETRLSLYVGPTSGYYKPHHVKLAF